MRFDWRRRGGYEVSSKGAKQYSALNARMPDGRTIEQHYQLDVKGWDPGGTDWRYGKGKPPRFPMSHEEQWHAYLNLWRIWAKQHPDMLIALYGEIIHHYDAPIPPAADAVFYLSDCFASTDINQARALAILLNEHYAGD
jgi:hypothetical protein